MLQNLLFASLSHLRNLKLKRVINSIFKSKDIISNLVKLEYFDIVELKLLNFNFFNTINYFNNKNLFVCKEKAKAYASCRIVKKVITKRLTNEE